MEQDCSLSVEKFVNFGSDFGKYGLASSPGPSPQAGGEAKYGLASSPGPSPRAGDEAKYDLATVLYMCLLLCSLAS